MSKERLNSGVEIEKAGLDDLDNVWNVIHTCSTYLESLGLMHWSNYYTREKVEEMLRDREVYLVNHGHKFVGTITYCLNPPKYYEENGYTSFFTEPTEKAAYVSAVGVVPAQQKKGIAGDMLAFVEERAKASGAKYVRLDCRVEVPGIVNFYTKRGYTIVGGSEWPEDGESYKFMEKKLG